MKRALVLSGGAVKGAFQAGAVSELLRSGFVPDVVYGVSVGALNGAFLVDRAGRAVLRHEAPDWPRIGEELESLWRNRVTSSIAIGNLQTGLTLVHSLLSGRFTGVIDPVNMYKIVHNEFKLNNLRNSPVRLFVGFVNVSTGGYTTVDATSPDIIDYLIASASIPLMMPVREVSGRALTDGGLRVVAPIRQALDDETDEIVCVLCQAAELSWVNVEWRNPVQLLNRMMDVVASELVNRELEWVHHMLACHDRNGAGLSDGAASGPRRVSMTVIRPPMEPAIDMCAFSVKQINRLVAEGCDAAREALQARERALAQEASRLDAYAPAPRAETRARTRRTKETSVASGERPAALCACLRRSHAGRQAAARHSDDAPPSASAVEEPAVPAEAVPETQPPPSAASLA